MKTISEDMQSSLAGDTLSLCLCWELTRQDGVQVRVTDHDQPLMVNGKLYETGVSIEGARFSQTSDLRPGRVSGTTVLSSDGIDKDDLLAGVWDRTDVSVMRVDWRAPERGGVLIWSGHLSEVTLSGVDQFEAELVSLKAAFEKPVGRTISRTCSAVLGDQNCGAAVLPGQVCDKSFESCQNIFGNAQRFRGFPHLPGPDFVLAGPAGNGTDGGKR